jgi:hypothetical protein
MRRLEQQGEYFSEHAMRQREPLVWQECIGALEVGLLPAPCQAGRHTAQSQTVCGSFVVAPCNKCTVGMTYVCGLAFDMLSLTYCRT